MNLNDLTDGTPLTKPWLNIVCDSIECLTTYSQNEISLGSVVTNNGSGTLNIPAIQLVNGIIGATSAATLTIQLPSASVINAYLAPLPLAGDITFKFTVCGTNNNGAGGNVHLVLPVDATITTFDGAAFANPTVSTGTQRVFYFNQSFLSSNWVIYY